ncbi:MAG: TetR/AcrR family transcriptional regulator [Cyclobacteriaceae bacterium]|jgi:AcrR family transcriptional regulator|nr:TetR/AcrR family transcriptional regulator [Cyclobacteriaceae bacterium]
MATLTFRLNQNLYLRDPQHTDLGQKIIRKSVEMIDKLGFEHFTFKKLADEIESTEASVYRYFENKHRLLLYLISWYWSWLDYRIDLFTSSSTEAEAKLRACLRVLCEEKKYDPAFEFINEEALHRIVVAELDKTYLTKSVDHDNQEGLFVGFKSLCKKIAGWVAEINPAYPYPNALISMILLSAKQQIFFADHLPSLTNLPPSADRHQKLNLFLEEILFRTIQKN